MNNHIQKIAMTCVAAMAMLISSAAVQADDLQNFIGGGAFNGVYGTFAQTPGAAGVTLTATNGEGGAFTGFSPLLVFGNNDILQITAQLTGANDDDQFSILLLDEDGPGTGEAYLYTGIQTSNFNTAGMTTFTVGPLSGFTAGPNDAFGRTPGDDILNFDAGPNNGMYEFQIQGDFQFTGQTLGLIVERVSIIRAIPEPGSAVVLGIGLLGMTARRRRS